MRNKYFKNIIQRAKLLLVVMIGFFAFGASGQTFSIDSVSDDTFYYPYESVDVFFFSENNEWPSDSTFYYFIDLDADGQYDSDDYLLASGSDTTLEATLPNIPGTYNLYVMAGNDGTVGESLERNYSFGSSANGTLDGASPFEMDQATDREVFINTDDYDDGNSYTLFIELQAPLVTASNPIVVEYSTDAGTSYTTLSDVEGESSFSAFDDSTFVFSLPEGALAQDVLIRISQENASTLAVDEEEWTLVDITIQSTDGTLIEYGITGAYGLTIESPDISLGGDSLSVYVGEDIGVAYESFGYTTGASFYLYAGDIEDPDNRIIYGSSSSLSDSITGTWGYSETNIDLRIAGYYGNIDIPEYDLAGDTLSLVGTSQDDYNIYFDLAGIRSATSPSLDIEGEEYATLELSLESDGIFLASNALLVQYNVGAGWVTIDSLYGNVDDDYEFDITSAMLSTATSFRVRQANTGNASGDNEWALYNFDVNLHELQGSSAFVPNTGNYPLFYSLSVQGIFEINETDDTVSISSAYPGDEIIVYATAGGFDVDADSLNYAVVIDGTYLLENIEVNLGASADSILIVGTIPADITYDTNLDIQVKLYSGDDAVVGLNVDVFNDYDAEEEDSEISYMGGEYDSGTKSITFEESGDRWVTTPGINIPITSGLTMDFTIKRTGARSPSGTEVVLEYSTDEGVSYSTIGTYSINAGGSSGTSYTLDETDLGDVSGSSTVFRFRQLTNNGVDLDGWTLSNVVFNNGTTILSYSYLNYNGDVLDVSAPVITLEEFDSSEDYYPGEDLEVTFSLDSGQFPSSTTFALLLDLEFGATYKLGEFSSTGTHTIKVPSISGGVYTTYILADYNDVASDSVSLTINDVEITNISITSDESTTDGDYEFIYPGNTITLTYETIGEIGEDVLAYLEVYDNNSEVDDYVTIIDSVEVGEAIEVELPVGLDYDGEPEFRLTLMDMSGNQIYETFSQNWYGNTEESEVYFPEEDRVGTSNNYYYYSGERSAMSIPLDFTYGGQVDFNLVMYYGYVVNQPVYFQYSIDQGETWEDLYEGTITSSTYVDLMPAAVEIPEEAWQDSVYVRFITNEDGLAGNFQNYLQFRGFAVDYTVYDPVAQEEFDLGDVSDLSLETLSVSLATLEDTDFNLGEEFTVQYNADGPFGDVDFAVVMEETGSGDYKVLAESDQTGAVELTVSAPEIPFGNASPNYTISVYPFVKVSETDTYRAAAETEDLTDEDDFVAVSGADDTTPTFYFDQDGERYLTTRAVSLENYEFATLNFTSSINASITTMSTLPVLEASTDGETFEIIPVTGATYEDQGYVYPGMSYNVEIPEEYLVEQVWFRWRQPLNGGEDHHTWSVYDISVSKGESNVFNTDAYTSYNMPQDVSLNEPDLSNYIWTKSDSVDAVYNGEDFEFTWEIDTTDIDKTTFPDGTMFIFTLDGVTDPTTGEELELASGTTYGTYTGTIPYYVENDAYDINLTAYVTYTDDDGEDAEYYFFEEDQIPSASLDVFNRVIRTVFADEDTLGTIYAGSTLNFSFEVENEEDAGTFTDLYSNLVVTYNSSEWLLASELGATSFDIDMPPYMTGSLPFEIRLSEDGPIGEVGDKLESTDYLSNLENDEDNFLRGDVDGDVVYESSIGRRLITTRDFSGEELSNTEILRYYAYFNKESDELTTSQHVVFEYSLDEGATYAQLDTFPTPGSAGMVDEYYSYTVMDAMKSSEAVRFRWRQEEASGYFELDDISFDYAEAIPFDYISTSATIIRQVIDVTSIDQSEICAGDSITVNYEVRGVFGDDVELYVGYYDETTGDSDDLDAEFDAISEGSGSVTFVLPDNAMDDDYDNGEFTFYVGITDNTFDVIGDPYGGTYSAESGYSDERLEVVQLINELASVSVTSSNACDLQDVVFSLYNVQEGFLYEVREVESETVVGSLTYESDPGITQINIGTITEDTDYELVVTSMSSTGSTCNTLVMNSVTSYVTENYELSLKYTEYDPVVAGDNDSTVVCEGSYPSLTLGLVRPTGSSISASHSNVEWFKDNFDNPISASGYAFGDDESLEAGEYFARITDGSCVYLTESFKVVNVETPDAPEITVVSGDLVACSSSIEVELSAPDGFAYYSWSNGETTQTITVDEAASYTVQVGNTFTCLSAASEAIDVEAIDAVEFLVYSSDLDNTLSGSENIIACSQAYFETWDIENNEDTENAGTGAYVIYKDGVADQSVTGYSITIDESGEYFVEWVSDILNPNACTTTSPTFTVEIVDPVDERPVISADGSLSFCEGDTVTLSAPTGFDYYQWKRESTILQENTETLDVMTSGSYTVEVSNVPFSNGSGCGSDASIPIVVNVFSELDLNIIVGSTTANNMQIFEECDEATLAVTGQSGTYNVTWYMDDVELTGIGSSATSIEVTQSGTYYAEITRSVANILDNTTTCVSATVPVVVEIYETPEAVSIADPGTLTFCEEEVDVTLTADAGAAFYRWYNDGSLVSDIQTSNTLHVTEAGEYYVIAYAYEDGCGSEMSNIITIEAIDLPSNYSSSAGGYLGYDFEADCGTGVVVELKNTQPEFSYQLVDEVSGANIGTAVTGASGSVFIDVADATEDFDFDVLISYADGGSGCEYYYDVSWNVEVNNVVLELDGITLTAMRYGDYISGEIRWYRNDVELVNKEGATSITVLDAATYTVEVDYYGGCTITSNAVDLSSSGRSSTQLADNQIVASTYPNPSADVVNLDIPGEDLGTVKIQIYSLSGQIVISESFEKDAEEFVKAINVSGLDAGVYNITVAQGNKVENIRIVKQ